MMSLWENCIFPLSWTCSDFPHAHRLPGCGAHGAAGGRARPLQKRTLWLRASCKLASQLSFALEAGLGGQPPGDQGMGEQGGLRASHRGSVCACSLGRCSLLTLIFASRSRKEEKQWLKGC